MSGRRRAPAVERSARAVAFDLAGRRLCAVTHGRTPPAEDGAPSPERVAAAFDVALLAAVAAMASAGVALDDAITGYPLEGVPADRLPSMIDEAEDAIARGKAALVLLGAFATVARLDHDARCAAGRTN